MLGVHLSSDQIESQILLWVLLLPFLTSSSILTFIGKKIKAAKQIISLFYVASSGFIIFTLLADLIYVLNGEDHVVWPILSYLIFVFCWNARAVTIQKTIPRILVNSVVQVVFFLILVFAFIYMIDFFFPEGFMLDPSV